jgi:purine-binding chemotaxis protein CheW
MPPFVQGVAVIRGMPVPVVTAALLLGENGPSSPATRFVAIKAAGRRVALAVDQVLGIRAIDAKELSGLPPLLAAASEQVVSAIGTLDGELLLVLRSGRFVPEEVWTVIDAGDTR